MEPELSPTGANAPTDITDPAAEAQLEERFAELLMTMIALDVIMDQVADNDNG